MKKLPLPLPKPHSSKWFKKFSKINYRQCMMTIANVGLAKSEEICTICGDSDDGRAEYVDFDSGLNLYLCQTCKRAQESMYGSRFDLLIR